MGCGSMRKTELPILIGALRILVKDIQSDDGIANMCLAEAADRLEELEQALRMWKDDCNNEGRTADSERNCYNVTCIALGDI
mgnify:CR=1 FL=1